MSALNILGGIGQGLMQGSEAVGQMRQREAYQKYMDAQTEGLRANQERAKWEHDNKVQEKEKLDQLNLLSQNIEANYGDRPSEERSAMRLQYASQLGLLSEQQRATLEAGVRELTQMGAMEAIASGDEGRMSQIMTGKFKQPITAKRDPSGGWAFAGQNGNVLQQMTKEQVDVLGGIGFWQNQQAARAEAAKFDHKVRMDKGDLAIKQGNLAVSRQNANISLMNARNSAAYNQGMLKLYQQKESNAHERGTESNDISRLRVQNAVERGRLADQLKQDEAELKRLEFEHKKGVDAGKFDLAKEGNRIQELRLKIQQDSAALKAARNKAKEYAGSPINPRDEGAWRKTLQEEVGNNVLLVDRGTGKTDPIRERYAVQQLMGAEVDLPDGESISLYDLYKLNPAAARKYLEQGIGESLLASEIYKQQGIANVSTGSHGGKQSFTDSKGWDALWNIVGVKNDTIVMKNGASIAVKDVPKDILAYLARYNPKLFEKPPAKGLYDGRMPAINPGDGPVSGPLDLRFGQVVQRRE